MSVLIAVVVVGLASLLLRLLPLLAAQRLPDRAAEVAEHAGVALLSAITVRAVVLHQDEGLPGAPLVAGIAAGLGLFLAFRGRSVLVAVAAGAAAYTTLSALLRAII
jgi:branched-subunit amino acid transport protein